MKICMIGAGYVGLVSAACFSEFGWTVTCVDKDENRSAELKAGRSPIYEPGLDALMERNMTAGRGFIALAALILAKWRPVPVLVACLFFGFTEALTIQMQGVVKMPSGEDIPVQFIQIIPYVLTIIVLAGFIG